MGSSTTKRSPACLHWKLWHFNAYPSNFQKCHFWLFGPVATFTFWPQNL